MSDLRERGAIYRTRSRPGTPLIYTYALFIPNTWRRAAVAIGAMAVVPMALLLGMICVVSAGVPNTPRAPTYSSA